MQLHDFLGQVQSRARMPDMDEALRATRATFETLAERLGGNEPQQLAAQLPEELGRFLEVHGESQRFDSDEFLKRVSQREHADLPVSVYHTRVVLEVLREAVSPGEIEDVIGQLPEDYKRLFNGSEGSMHA